MIGGTLLLAPGFITDIFGLLLLIPPTRAIARGLLRRFSIARFAVVGVPGAGSVFGAGTNGAPQPPSRDYDFEATAEEVPAEDASDPRLPPSDA